MARLFVGFLVASSIVALACQNMGGGGPTTPPPYGQPGASGAPGYGAPPGYGGPQAAYGQPGAYPAPYGGQPQPGYPGAPQPAGPVGYPQPGYPAPGLPPPGPAPAGGGVMAVPGPAAFPCSNDSACGLAHCNTQNGPDGKPYNKCAFPCADPNVDCIPGAACLAGFCVPKPPGS